MSCVVRYRGLCDELVTRPEEFYRLCCVVVCDLETSRIGSPYIYDISSLTVKLVEIQLPNIFTVNKMHDSCSDIRNNKMHDSCSDIRNNASEEV